jgi:hypothetical protein
VCAGIPIDKMILDANIKAENFSFDSNSSMWEGRGEKSVGEVARGEERRVRYKGEVRWRK